jgi:hypothetical protein
LKRRSWERRLPGGELGGAGKFAEGKGIEGLIYYLVKLYLNDPNNEGVYESGRI